MKQARQKATHRCDRCGAQAPVTRSDTLHEFPWKCICGNAGVISWDNAASPPTFDAPAGSPAGTAASAGPQPKQKGKAAMDKFQRDQRLLDNAVATDEKVSQVLICDLTNDEQRERGLQLANALADGRKLTDDKKAVINDFKARELEMATRVNQLEQVVSTRREYREVECTEWRDYKAGKVYVVRDDLGTIAETRGMTPSERQQQLLPNVAEPSADESTEKTDESKSKTKSRQASRAATASA